MLTKVKLYGVLGKKFGKEHSFDIEYPAEAINALLANYPTLEKELINLKYGVKVLRDDQPIYEPVHFIDPIVGEGEIKIIPIIAGADSGDWLMIVAGVLLVVVAWWIAPAVGGAFGSFMESGILAADAAITWGEVVAYVGMALVFTGVSNLLFRPPEADDTEEKSYSFSGPINRAKPGEVVPIGYGTLWIGSQVISGSLTNDDVVE